MPRSIKVTIEIPSLDKLLDYLIASDQDQKRVDAIGESISSESQRISTTRQSLEAAIKKETP